MRTIKILSIVFVLLFIYTVNTNAQVEFIEGLRQPAQLTIQHEPSDSNVYLSWWNPGDPTWLYYGNGSVYGMVNFAVGHYEIATKYDKQDFTPYHGMSLKTMAFVAELSGHPYTLCVWTGDNGDVLEYSQEIDTVDVTNWNYVDLTTPLVIDTSKTYYIGLAFDVTVDGPAAGIDWGPAKEKGGLIRNSEGVFISILEYELNNNWAMALYIENDEIAREKIIVTQEQNKTVCSTGLLKPTRLNTKLKLNTEIKSTKAVSYFNIYRNQEIVATSDTARYHDHLLEGGVYNYEVTAVYAEGESYPSNSVEVFYDNSRIRKNIMVLESFINTSEREEGELSSPGSPGAVKGVHEMNYQYDVAPIAYHSGIELLGVDPFSFPEGEVRWWYYMSKTLAFPATHFNGNTYLGGGQDASMFEPYEEVYNSVKNIKTAVAQESYLEGINSNTYKLHSNFEIVGTYDTKHLVVHTVVTESSIDYSWHSGEFDNVNFVAREMIPDANGTFVTFVDNKTSISQDITIDAFTPKENINVITFIQDTLTWEIVNAEKLPIPSKKVITFEVKSNDALIENVAISINDEMIYTDKDGIAKIALFDNIGEVAYTASLDNYHDYNGTFLIDTTETVSVNMYKVDIASKKEAIFKVYPNPVNDVVYVQSNTNFHCLLTDVSGKVIKRIIGFENHQEINISDLENGIYFIQTQTGESKQVFKILKQ